MDGVPGMVPLLAAADPEAARSPLRRHLELCLGERPFHWSWRYAPGAGRLADTDPPPGWSRDPAWLLLALAEAACLPGGDEFAGHVASLVPEHLVPPADTARPDGPRDTSAAAVTASALLLLGHRDRAVAVLEELVGGQLTADGRLLDGCYDLAAGTAVRHEPIWGTFFLAYALAELVGPPAAETVQPAVGTGQTATGTSRPAVDTGQTAADTG
ncbi:hypothetical protein ACFWH4_32950 [Streptomyces sp. NPDC127091]|uniref:hypothetical protein n=1 Tax=Streptomyces sp. NPDC127091 TaxID=3347134 RepID=UPI00364E2091